MLTIFAYIFVEVFSNLVAMAVVAMQVAALQTLYLRLVAAYHAAYLQGVPL